MEKNNRKIVIVTDEQDALGGVQKFIESLSLNFASHGFKVSIISRFHSKSRIEYNRSGIETTNIFDKSFSDLISRRNDKTLSIEEQKVNETKIRKIVVDGQHALSRIISSWDANTVVIVTQVGSLMELFDCGLESGRDDSPKVIAQYHGTYEYAIKQSYIQLLDNLFPKCNKSLFLTKEDTFSFRGRGIENAETMVNGINRIPYADLLKIEKENVVVSMGRYASEKNLEDLILAWAMVAKEFPDWRLELYGSGPEEEKIRNLIEEYDLEGSALLCGLAANVNETLARSRINVMSSHKEGFPVSLLEAAACAVPSVAYNAGPSTKELIADGVTGYITNRNTPASLAVNLRSLMGNERARAAMAQAAYHSSERYDMLKIMDRWLKLIDSLTGIATGSELNTSNVPQAAAINSINKKGEPNVKFDFIMKSPSDSVTIAYSPPAVNLPDKAYVFQIDLFDIEGTQIDPSQTSLSYSESLNSGFVYSPANQTLDPIVMPIVKATIPIRRITISPVAWALRKAKVKPVITEFYCESSTLVENDLWYRLEMPAQIASVREGE